MHNLELATNPPANCVPEKNAVRRKVKVGRCAMGVALQVNVALWLMLGSVTMEAIRLAEYLH
jgi:hypothetical protein